MNTHPRVGNPVSSNLTSYSRRKNSAVTFPTSGSKGTKTQIVFNAYLISLYPPINITHSNIHPLTFVILLSREVSIGRLPLLMGTVFQPPSSTSGRPRPGTKRRACQNKLCVRPSNPVPLSCLQCHFLRSSVPSWGLSGPDTWHLKKVISGKLNSSHCPSSITASNSLIGGPGGPPRRLSLPLAISCCTFMCSRCSSISASLWIWSMVLGPWSPRRGTQLLCGDRKPVNRYKKLHKAVSGTGVTRSEAAD